MSKDYHKYPRLYIDAAISANVPLPLNTEQWHYLRNVMRLNDGDNIMIFNGHDGEWFGCLIFETKKRLLISPIKQTKPQPPKPQLVYAFAPLKKGRIDYMVQKATELGTGILQPIITDYTVNHKIKPQKLIANAIEAAEQCTMLNIPTINPIIKFTDFIDSFSQTHKIIFCDEKQASSSPINIISTLKGNKICVLIGPEGGFSPSEREQLYSAKNTIPISLGSRIMRADTAAISALTLVQATIGDW